MFTETELKLLIYRSVEMGIIVDLIIIGIGAISTYLAYKKGVVELAISLCAFLIAIVVTFLLYQPISNLIIHITSIDEAIEDTIYEKANEVMQTNETKNDITNQVIETTKNEMLPETARNLAIGIVKAFVSILLFIAVKITLKFISALADVITKLPIIKQLNQTGGILYGLVRGILIIYVILLIIAMVELIMPNNPVKQSIDQSYLGKAMYQNNYLRVFFVKNS